MGGGADVAVADVVAGACSCAEVAIVVVQEVDGGAVEGARGWLFCYLP